MDPIYVTGHRNPDTDSIVSAMAYAALRNGTRRPGATAPPRLGHVSDETQLVLDRFGFPAAGAGIKTMRTQVRDLRLSTHRLRSASGVTISRAWDVLLSDGLRPSPPCPSQTRTARLFGMLSSGDIAA